MSEEASGAEVGNKSARGDPVSLLQFLPPVWWLDKTCGLIEGERERHYFSAPTNKSKCSKFVSKTLNQQAK